LKRICFIQPLLTNYRIPLFKDMAKRCYLDIIYSEDKKNIYEAIQDKNDNINYIMTRTINIFNIFFYQKKIIKYILKYRPYAVIIFANQRYLSYWLILFICKLYKIKVFPHGLGYLNFWSTNKMDIFHKISFMVMFHFATGYICYTKSIKETFERFGFKKKLYVADNMIYNNFVIKSSEKKFEKFEILFLGRLSEKSNIELLINCLKKVNSTIKYKIKLHIIGNGIKKNFVIKSSNQEKWLYYYGSIYKDEKIAHISKRCSIFCYPGNIGLSIVHSFSLSLPILIHNDFLLHFPEASYAKENYNCILFDEKDKFNSLYKKLLYLTKKEKTYFQKISENAYQTYLYITEPSMGEKIYRIINN